MQTIFLAYCFFVYIIYEISVVLLAISTFLFHTWLMHVDMITHKVVDILVDLLILRRCPGWFIHLRPQEGITDKLN